MSWEGYLQCLCAKGHYFIADPYTVETCPHCASPAAFNNVVDDTNCDSVGEIPLEELDKFKIAEATTTICTQCTHVHMVEPARFRVPTEAEHRRIRHWRPGYGGTPLVKLDDVERGDTMGEGERGGIASASASASASTASVDAAGVAAPGGFYSALRRTLLRAYVHAAEGKGAERHATPGVQFEDQPICEIGCNLGSNHFEIGQAVKKALESVRLAPPAAAAELLGAINYLAAAVIVLEKLQDNEEGDHRGE